MVGIYTSIIDLGWQVIYKLAAICMSTTVGIYMQTNGCHIHIHRGVDWHVPVGDKSLLNRQWVTSTMQDRARAEAIFHFIFF